MRFETVALVERFNSLYTYSNRSYVCCIQPIRKKFNIPATATRFWLVFETIDDSESYDEGDKYFELSFTYPPSEYLQRLFSTKELGLYIKWGVDYI